MEDRIEREEYNLSKSTLIWVSVAIKQAAMSKEVLDEGQFGLVTRCMVKDDQDECIEVATDEFLYCFIDWTTLEAILEKITEWWPDAKMSEITITSECVHTDCLTYDLYDPSDYTNFIVINLSKKG